MTKKTEHLAETYVVIVEFVYFRHTTPKLGCLELWDSRANYCVAIEKEILPADPRYAIFILALIILNLWFEEYQIRGHSHCVKGQPRRTKMNKSFFTKIDL